VRALFRLCVCVHWQVRFLYMLDRSLATCVKKWQSCAVAHIDAYLVFWTTQVACKQPYGSPQFEHDVLFYRSVTWCSHYICSLDFGPGQVPAMGLYPRYMDVGVERSGAGSGAFAMVCAECSVSGTMD
jgi:hypothetical protein